MVREHAASLRQHFNADVVIANGENAAGGSGITPATAEEIFSAGVDYITTGNHIWNRKEILPYLDAQGGKICRPLNYPPNAGQGFIEAEIETVASGKMKLAIVNLACRIFMSELADCPFAALKKFLGERSEGGITIVDLHGEATSEKVAFGYAFDGQVDAVLGTHTHVQTADERILPKGTAYISDVGMCGAYESVIGVEIEPVISNFVTGMKSRFSTASGRGMLNGVLLKFSGTERSIERIRIIEEGK